MSDFLVGGKELGDFAEELVIAADSMQPAEIAAQYGSDISVLDDDQACQLRVAVEGISVTGMLNPELESKVLDTLEGIKEGNLFTDCEVPNIDYEAHVPPPEMLPKGGW